MMKYKANIPDFWYRPQCQKKEKTKNWVPQINQMSLESPRGLRELYTVAIKKASTSVSQDWHWLFMLPEERVGWEWLGRAELHNGDHFLSPTLKCMLMSQYSYLNIITSGKTSHIHTLHSCSLSFLTVTYIIEIEVTKSTDEKVVWHCFWVT